MSEDKHPNKEEILLEITCKIKKQADLKTSINSNKVRFYPDNLKQIYVCEHSEALINETCKSLAIEAVKSENNFARSYLPIDTRLITCLLPDYKASVRQTSQLVEKSLEELLELRKTIEVEKNELPSETHISNLPNTKIEFEETNIPEVVRGKSNGLSIAVDNSLPQNKRESKWLDKTVFLLGCGLMVGSVLVNFAKNINNFPTTEVLTSISPTSSSTKLIDLTYIKNDAVSNLLSFAPNISSIAINDESIVVAAQNKLLISDRVADRASRGRFAYSNPREFNLDINITAIDISNDGKIAVGADNGRIIILDANGKQIDEFDQAYEITSIAFSNDGENIIAGGIAGNLEIFSLVKRTNPLSLLGHFGAINKIVSTEDNIVTAGADNTVRIWNFQGKQLKLFKDDSEVFSLAVESIGNYIFTGNARGIIRKWDIKTEKEVDSFSWQNQKISTLAIANNILVSGSNDRSVMLLDLGDRNNRKIFSNLNSYINAVAISPDGKTIFGANKNNVNVWVRH